MHSLSKVWLCRQAEVWFHSRPDWRSDWLLWWWLDPGWDTLAVHLLLNCLVRPCLKVIQSKLAKDLCHSGAGDPSLMWQEGTFAPIGMEKMHWASWTSADNRLLCCLFSLICLRIRSLKTNKKAMRNVRAKVQLFSPIPSFISCAIRQYCKICNAWVSHKCLFGNFAIFVNMYVFSFIPRWADPQTSEFGEDVMWEDFFSLSLLGCYMNELHEVFLIVCKWAWCIHPQGGISVKVCLSSIHRKNPPS